MKKALFTDPDYQLSPDIVSQDAKLLSAASKMMLCVADGGRLLGPEGQAVFPTGRLTDEEVREYAKLASLRLKTLAIFASLPEELREDLSKELIARQKRRTES